MRSNLHLLSTLFMVLSLGFSHSSQAQLISTVTTNSTSIGQHEKLEVTIQLNQGFTNPYDPAQVRVYAYMVDPGGQGQEIDAFYFEDFNRVPDPSYPSPPYPFQVDNATPVGTPGNGVFKVRFAPDQIGQWQFAVVLMVNGAYVDWKPFQNYTCVASSNKGHIRVRDNNYFEYDNGDIFYPVGMNFAHSWEPIHLTNGNFEWRAGNHFGTYEYDAVLQSMGSNGMNYARVFLDELQKNLWGYDPELNASFFDNTLNLKNAKEIDLIVEKAEEQGVYLQLCFFMAGALTDDLWFARWSGHATANGVYYNNERWPNPFNAAFGGTCQQPRDFFDTSDPATVAMQKNLFRYIISRWGYSTNIFSWEFFNEVNQVRFGHYDADPNNTTVSLQYHPTVTAIDPAYETLIKDWHLYFANYLKTIDPNDHLVSTSFAGADNNNYDSGYQHDIFDAMDFVQYHPYMGHNSYNHIHHKDFQEFLYRIAEKQKLNFPDKPLLFTEGDYIRVNDINYDPGTTFQEKIAFDPHGVGFHTYLWSNVFHKSGGTLMSWGWGDVDTRIMSQRYVSFVNNPKYPHYKAISDFVTAHTSLFADDNLFYKCDPEQKFQGITCSNNPELRVYSMASSDQKEIAGWVQDINYKMESLYANKAYDPSNNRTTHMPDDNDYLYTLSSSKPAVSSNNGFTVENARNGSYTVNWYSSMNAASPFLTETATASNGVLNLTMPAALRNSDYGDAVFSATFDYCGNNYWHLVDIPATITLPNAVDGFVEYQGKFLYRNTSNQVYAMWWANFQWNTANVTSLAGAPSDCAGDLTVLDDKVFYRTTSGNLRAIWLNGSWQHTTLDHNLGPLTNVDGGLAVYGSKLFYRTTANGVNVIWYDGVWKQSDLSNDIGVLTNVEGDLFTYHLWGKKLFYATSSGDINVIYWDGVWLHGDLSNDIGNLNNLGTQNGDFAQLGDKMFYRTNTNGLNVIWWDDQWYHHDMVNELGTLTDVAGDLTVYADQLFYRSTSGNFRRVWYDPIQSTWVRSDLMPDVTDPGNLIGDLEVFDDLLIHRISGNKLEGLIWGNPCKYATQSGTGGPGPGPKKHVADQEVVEEDNVLLFPNPADGSVVTNITKDLRVFNINGAAMTPVVTPQSGRVVISTSEWPNGIYIVTGTTESGHPAREKVIIMH